MGLFSLGSSVMGGGSTNLWGQPYSTDLYKTATTPTSTAAAPRTASTAASGGSGGFTMGSGWSGGLAAGAPIVRPRSTTTSAPAPSGDPGLSAVSTAGTVGGGGRVTSGGSPNYGGGGGGGGGGSFSYNINNAAPVLSQSPGFDFAGLLSGMSSLMSQDQQGDVPGNVPLTTQKDTMALQGLRESSAGWGENIAGPGPNPSLGQRIPPDETKKLAAMQSARIY